MSLLFQRFHNTSYKMKNFTWIWKRRRNHGIPAITRTRVKASLYETSCTPKRRRNHCRYLELHSTTRLNQPGVSEETATFSRGSRWVLPFFEQLLHKSFTAEMLVFSLHIVHSQMESFSPLPPFGTRPRHLPLVEACPLWKRERHLLLRRHPRHLHEKGTIVTWMRHGTFNITLIFFRLASDLFWLWLAICIFICRSAGEKRVITTSLECTMRSPCLRRKCLSLWKKLTKTESGAVRQYSARPTHVR